MSRFIVANRRAGLRSDDDRARARRAADAFYDKNLRDRVDVVGDVAPKDPTGRRIVWFEVTERMFLDRLELPKAVLLEPSIAHVPAVDPTLRGEHRVDATARDDFGSGFTLRVRVVGADDAAAPVAGARVVVTFDDLDDPGGENGPVRQAHATDDNGVAMFTYGLPLLARSVLVLPAEGFYNARRVLRPVVRGDRAAVTIPLAPLPHGPLGWWHRGVGVDRLVRDRGDGIRVGVVDTGLGPNPALAHARSVGAFLHGRHESQLGAGVDVEGHGTHVCGIIGARPRRPEGFWGVAPGAALFSARVFDDAGKANQGDIANAIDYLAQDARVDLINLSLASDLPSEILRDALIDARDQGTLPIAAAGNAGVASPAFPAAFPEAPAVAALGQLGQIPADALSADNHPRFLDRYGVGGWFLARFSNYGGWPSWGSAVAVAAPGVGIVSTVPDVDDRKESFAARSGTSMATPMTCGALATRLAADGDYRKLSRGRHRADRAEAILRAATLPIGTWPFFVGCGLPRAA